MVRSSSVSIDYLFHGTKKEVATTICQRGMDERVCSLGGLFGAGMAALSLLPALFAPADPLIVFFFNATRPCISARFVCHIS